MERNSINGAAISNQALLDQVFFLAGELNSNLDEMLFDYGMNYNSYSVLRVLAELPQSGISLSELAAKLGWSSDKLIRPFKILLKQEYVTTSNDRMSDNAVAQITLKGGEILNSLEELKAVMDLSFSNLGSIEKVSLYRLLNKVKVPWVLKAVG